MDAKQKYDAKQARRKQNRALRRHGLETLPLGAHSMTPSKLVKRAQIGELQKRAEHDVRLRSERSRHGGCAAKDKLNDVWTNRVSRNLTGFWRQV